MDSTTHHTNRWLGVGRVAQEIRHGKTGGGDDVCSFQVTTTSRGDRLTWVRVNVYDQDLVKYVRRKVTKGNIVRVEGELMNRNKGGRGQSGLQLTEVRAFLIEPIKNEGTDGNSRERSSSS